MNKKRLAIIAVALGVVASFVYYNYRNHGRFHVAPSAHATAVLHESMGDCQLINLSPKAIKLAKLTYTCAKEKVVPVTVEATGEVSQNLNTVVRVNSLVSGSVDSVLVNVGEEVQKGKVLAKIRSQDVEQIESDMLQQRAQVKADLSQALLDIDSQIESLNAQLKLSNSSYERSKILFDEKIASRAEIESSKTNLEKNNIDIATQKQKRANLVRIFDEKLDLVTEPAKQKLALLGVSTEQVDRIIATRRIEPVVEIVAPMRGLLSQRLCNPGELVQTGQNLFTVGNYKTVWLSAQIHEKDIHRVKLRQPILLTCESYPDKIFSGHLNYIAESVDKDTRTLLVRAEAVNPFLLLKPQMFASMKIIVSDRKMLVIDRAAIQDAGSEKVVYVALADGRFRETPVRLGTQCADHVEVVSGINEGDEIVSNGSFDLRAAAMKNAEDGKE